MKHLDDMKQLSFFLLLFCLAVSGFSQDAPKHALSVGFQMPAPEFSDNVGGEALTPTVFPIAVRYAATFQDQHEVGITIGGRRAPARVLIFAGDSLFSPSFPIFESRIDYRWLILGTEKKFQPFIGAGVWTTFSFTDNPVGSRLLINQTFQIIPGLKFQLSDRFFLSTELPMSLTSLWDGTITAVRNGSISASQAAEAMWFSQRSQLWPVISVGLNL